MVSVVVAVVDVVKVLLCNEKEAGVAVELLLTDVWADVMIERLVVEALVVGISVDVLAVANVNVSAGVMTALEFLMSVP